MKQKIVMEVLMPCEKCKSKAMQTAAVVPGVIKVEIGGKEKNQLVVVGDEIDSVKLTCKLRKKLKHAKIVTVEEDKEKPKEPAKPKEPEKPKEVTIPHVCYPQCTYEVVYDQNPTGCSIL